MKDFLNSWALGLVFILFTIACSTHEKEIPSKPNILFAIADDASFPHMSALRL